MVVITLLRRPLSRTAIAVLLAEGKVKDHFPWGRIDLKIIMAALTKNGFVVCLRFSRNFEGQAAAKPQKFSPGRDFCEEQIPAGAGSCGKQIALMDAHAYRGCGLECLITSVDDQGRLLHNGPCRLIYI